MKNIFTKICAVGFVFMSVMPAHAGLPGKDELDMKLIERGRYLIKITGCNDCHTPRYSERAGQVPEQEWLIGVGVGYKGPWGTTYAVNLRRPISRISEEQWIKYAKTMKAKPPMPWFNLNAMSSNDLKAMYHFIRYLGDSANEVPKELGPNVEPKTPYINFEVVNP